jgi:Right handed beta helix region
MRRIALMTIAAGLLISFWAVEPARALNLISFVSHSGLDSNPCTKAAPCLTFNTAVINTVPNGVVNCLDVLDETGIPGISIQQSITIDCTGETATLLAGNGFGGSTIDIALPPSDVAQTVRLRGLVINGVGHAAIGISISAAGTVVLENINIYGESQQGIVDVRTTAGSLIIKNSIISGNGGPGIVVAGAPGNAAQLDNVTSAKNTYGLAVGSGNSVQVSRSTFFRNSAAGVEGDGGSQIVVDDSNISHNNVGVASGSAVRLSNNNIAFNTTAISGASGTFGNNRFSGNGSPGTAPVPLGGASSDLGQQ